MEKEKNNRSLVSLALILVLGAIAPMLDITMTNVAVNTIMKDLSTTVDQVQWVTTAYVLALGIAVPITGWAIEWFSGKKIYLTGLLLFLIGSIVCSAAPSISILVVGRVIQGFGSGIIVPLLTTLLVQAAGTKGLGSLMSIVGIPAVLAPILGPTFGGFLLNALNWRWIFYVNIPIVIISGLVILLKMPLFKPERTGKKLDIPSIFLITACFTAFIMGISKISDLVANKSHTAIFPLTLSLIFFISYIFYAYKKPTKALISLSLFKIKNFSAATVLLLMSGLTVNGAMFLLPLFLQNIRGLSVVMSGIYLIAQGLGLLISRGIIGRLTDKIGARLVVQVSIIIGVISTLPFAFFDANTNDLWILIVLFIRGIAQGGLTIPIMTDSYNHVPKKLISEATTTTRMLQNMGGAIGTALLASVVQQSLNNVTPSLTNLTNAYQSGFWFATISLLIAIIPAFFLTSIKKEKK